MTFTDAITSASATIGLLRTALAARDDIKVQAALTELQSKYTELGGMAMGLIEKSFALQSALVEMNNENARLKLQLEEKSTYRLKELKPGKLAYFAEANSETGEPAHYICQPCKDAGIKSALRLTNRAGGLGNSYICPAEPRHGFSV